MNIAKMMKQAKQMQSQMKNIQDQLSDKEVHASTGGGVVSVTVSGDQQLKSIKIKPEACDPDDVSMLEDMILSAVNKGLQSAKDMATQEMSKVTGGMELPGIF